MKVEQGSKLENAESGKKEPIMLSSLDEYNKLQREEMLGQENTQRAREKFGLQVDKNPTHQQLYETYFEYGCPVKFSRKYTYPDALELSEEGQRIREGRNRNEDK